MVELIRDLDSATVASNLQRIGAELQRAAASGRSRRGAATSGRAPEILAATKYVEADDLPKLAQAGVTLVGENRAQDLDAKFAAHGALFEWDFIGRLQSRRVRLIAPHVRMIHSVASDSVLRELERHASLLRAGLRVLIEVNVSGEEEKDGVAPCQLDAFIDRCPVPVAGLMTMPPFAEDPQASRPWFAELRRMATERGLEHLSMGTSQDYLVAAEEGATIVRIGTSLYHPEQDRPSSAPANY